MGPMRFGLPAYWTIRTRIGTHPLLFEALYRAFNPHSPLLANRSTDVVIEGFPRSGNSFSVYAFKRAQGRELAVANHVHSPSQLVRAARFGLPACLLIREPAAAVAALATKVPHLNPRDLLRSYRLYYAFLLDYAAHFVVVPFSAVTGDVGVLIRRLNARFGTRFAAIDRATHRAYTISFLAAEIAHGPRERLPYLRPKDRAAPVSEEAVARHAKRLDACREVYERYLDLARTLDV